MNKTLTTKQKKEMFEGSTGLIIPDNYKVVQSTTGQGVITVIRPDRFKIFLNPADDGAINLIRLQAAPKDVMLDVGLYRGMQIANNYRDNHHKKTKINYLDFVRKILKNVSKIKLLKEVK